MNDRELLERAAKSAGIKGEWDGLTGWFVPRDGFAPASHQFYWNPLLSDGDALRLAVKMNLAVHIFKIHTSIIMGSEVWSERHDSDPYAATRRVIVRAAAEIDKSTK